MAMLDELRPIGYWLRRGLRLREALDTRPPPEDIALAAQSMLDFWVRQGGGEFSFPPGRHLASESPLGNRMSVSGPTTLVASDARPVFTDTPAGGVVRVSGIHFQGWSDKP